MRQSTITILSSLVVVALGGLNSRAEATARADSEPCYTRVWYTYDPCSFLDIQDICDIHCGFPVQYWSCQNSTPHHGALTIICVSYTGDYP
jgi:hypothetical protein